MRLIDDYLPEEEILKIYLGTYQKQFKEQMAFANSPTKGRILIAVFSKIIKIHSFNEGESVYSIKLKAHYTKTKNAVRLTLKRHLEDNENEWLDESESWKWFTDREWLFPVDDPKGLTKFQTILAEYLDSANQDSSDENSDENCKLDPPTSA